MSDETLADLAKTDEIAFATLCTKYRPYFLQIARRYLRYRINDHEDFVQECCLKIFLNMHTFRAESKFKTWATSIAINCALMRIRTIFYRSEHPANTLLLDHPLPYTDSKMYHVIAHTPHPRLDAALDVNKLVGTLSSRELDAVKRIYCDGWMYKELGAEEGLTEPGAKSLVRRALRKCREAA